MKARKILATVLTVATIFTAMPLCASADTPEIKGFSDVSEKRWSYESIMICAEKGAVNGTVAPDENGIGKYDPASNVTVGQFLAVITRLVAPEYIDDSVSGHWAQKYYNAACDSGIIDRGWRWPDTKEYLNSYITRERMAHILYNAAEISGETLEIENKYVQSIKDYYEVELFSNKQVLAAYSNGLITGFEDGTFRPQGNMTREQMAAVVCRLMEYTPRPEVAYNNEGVEELFDMDYFREHGQFSQEDSLRVAKEILESAKFVNNNGYLALSVTIPAIPEEAIDNSRDARYGCFGFRSIAYDAGTFFLYTWDIEGVSPGNTYLIELDNLVQYDLGGGLDEDTKVPVNALKRRLDTIYLDIWMPEAFGYTIRTGSDWGSVVGMNSSDDARDFTFDFDEIMVYDMF
ncbi:MAG: S-layer homology domain-containing protein [Clostridiales bacterium]|nr:S-layer homology domain-containing protein [Clostridiales bacterium]